MQITPLAWACCFSAWMYPAAVHIYLHCDNLRQNEAKSTSVKSQTACLKILFCSLCLVSQLSSSEHGMCSNTLTARTREAVAWWQPTALWSSGSSWHGFKPQWRQGKGLLSVLPSQRLCRLVNVCLTFLCAAYTKIVADVKRCHILSQVPSNQILIPNSVIAELALHTKRLQLC